mmetsp:Transcript_23970/g.53961  ORF Transcript_23970/g.53961 Transcript_23970/m.53961 type:complete len:182 (-) Transcript_23970:44-589(-)
MRAVWGMMKKNYSNRRIFKERLKLFAGPNHLYYNKNPIEYPMHKIKDCTHQANLRYRDRTLIYRKNVLAKKAKGDEFIQMVEDNARLKKYQAFLSRQLETIGEDAAKDMSMEEFVKEAEMKEFQRLNEMTTDEAPKKKKEKLFYETWLPKKKYSANRNQRKHVNRIPPVEVWKDVKVEGKK